MSDYRDLPGWLCEEAVDLTRFLMDRQNAARLPGCVIEFGVFRGKYLSVLYEASAPAARPVHGYDLFEGERNPAILGGYCQDVVANVAQVCGEADRLTMELADTLDLDGNRLLREHGPAAMISVDAGHGAVHLENDLKLVRTLLGPGGFAAIDDAFNHSTPGAIEGTCRYFEHANDGALTAFAHCYNKLFVCRAPDHAGYLAAVRAFMAAHADAPFVQRTQARAAENAAGDYVPTFFGEEMVPFL